jgi:superfamily I DNA/RNA helicase
MVASYREVVRQVVSFDGDTAQVLRMIMDIQGSKQSFQDSLIEQIDADDLAEELGREPTEEEIREAALVPIRPVMAVAENFQDPKKMMAFIHKLKKANSQTRKADEDPEPAVPIMTGHSWKGLEAKHIYISMAAGVFPPNEELMRRDEAPDPIIKAGTIEDERRLAYVAITRGEDSVTIMCPNENYRGQPSGVSQFVAEACIGIEGEVEPEENDEAAEDSPPPGRQASQATGQLSFASILDGFLHGASLGDLTEQSAAPELELEVDWGYLS